MVDSSTSGMVLDGGEVERSSVTVVSPVLTVCICDDINRSSVRIGKKISKDGFRSSVNVAKGLTTTRREGSQEEERNCGRVE